MKYLLFYLFYKFLFYIFVVNKLKLYIMLPKIINTFSKAPLKSLAKQLNLTFDKQFGYCISDAYNNDKGEPIPTYMMVGFRIFGLKYFDGCFNPYLVEYATDGFSFTSPYSSQNPQPIFTANYTPDAMAKLRQKYPNM